MKYKKLTLEEVRDIENGYLFELSEGSQLSLWDYIDSYTSVDKDWIDRDPVVKARIEKAIVEDDRLLEVLREILADERIWRKRW